MFLQFRAAAAGVVHIYHEEVYMLCYSIWISSYSQWFSNIKRYKNHLGSVPVKKSFTIWHKGGGSRIKRLKQFINCFSAYSREVTSEQYCRNQSQRVFKKDIQCQMPQEEVKRGLRNLAWKCIDYPWLWCTSGGEYVRSQVTVDEEWMRRGK